MGAVREEVSVCARTQEGGPRGASFPCSQDRVSQAGLEGDSERETRLPKSSAWGCGVVPPRSHLGSEASWRQWSGGDCLSPGRPPSWAEEDEWKALKWGLRVEDFSPSAWPQPGARHTAWLKPPMSNCPGSLPCRSLPANRAGRTLSPLEGRWPIEEEAQCSLFHTGGQWAARGVRWREWGVLLGRTRPLVTSSPGTWVKTLLARSESRRGLRLRWVEACAWLSAWSFPAATSAFSFPSTASVAAAASLLAGRGVPGSKMRPLGQGHQDQCNKDSNWDLLEVGSSE